MTPALQSAITDVGAALDALRGALQDTDLPPILAARLLIVLDWMASDLRGSLQTVEGVQASKAAGGRH